MQILMHPNIVLSLLSAMALFSFSIYYNAPFQCHTGCNTDKIRREARNCWLAISEMRIVEL